MKLVEIAQIMIGILVKREKVENGKNSYELFSLKSFENEQEYEKITTNKNFEDKLAKKGDLLFRLLYPNKIIYVDDKLSGLLIPSQFCIIRVKKEKMDPVVLKWYLESKISGDELDSKVTGSIIKSVSLTNLKTVEVPFTPLDEQKKMRELINLWEDEKKVTKQIIEEKEKLYNFYLEEMMRKGESGTKNGNI